MKRIWYVSVWVSAVMLLAVIGSASAQDVKPPSERPAYPQGTKVGDAFTYQGQLRNGPNNSTVNGTCDFQFMLYDAPSGGIQTNTTQTVLGSPVTNGLFSVEIDFGPHVFQGEGRWMAVLVRCPAGAGNYHA